jgi:TonB family protein
MKICLAAILLFLCLVQIGFAQDKTQTEQKKVTVCSDCGFPLKGKPIFLPAPEYPKAAKMVRASGAVQILVMIDESGNVVVAKAVSGNPLLHAAAIKSALQGKFNPVLLREKPIRVNGVITYNFVLDESILPEQIERPKVIVDLGGRTATGNAIKLVKPAFPSNCRCKFSKNYKTAVLFTVNENGNVESATGVAGHLLLKAASVFAIRNSKFSISRFDGAPVKAFGLITYDYFLLKNKFKSRVVKYELKLDKNELQK